MTTLIECPVDITDVSYWIPGSKIPSGRSNDEKIMNEKYGTSGVYQIAHVKDLDDISDNIVHKSIGYTGKSTDILSRTYSIRPLKGSHGVNRYIKQNNLDKETEVFIRYLYCSVDDICKLEDWIHNQSKKNFDYRFLWSDASEGNDGKYSRAQDALELLTSFELLDIILFAKELAISKNTIEFQNKLKGLV